MRHVKKLNKLEKGRVQFYLILFYGYHLNAVVLLNGIALYKLRGTNVDFLKLLIVNVVQLSRMEEKK
ncbi:hypothetical protein [Halobacillus salinus]|uniref:hypothetical protein n=1 Tax=Halobacillus salinus TaxID=192814 RepID=UPI001C37B86C|nr:hypothetical protein [Halobacillus salinus]